MGFGQGTGVLVRAPFEPLADASFRNKTRKALFLVAMATAKHVGELQALSFSVSRRGDDLVLHYDPFFLAKTEQIFHPKNQGSFITRDMFLGILILPCFCIR